MGLRRSCTRLLRIPFDTWEWPPGFLRFRSDGSDQIAAEYYRPRYVHDQRCIFGSRCVVFIWRFGGRHAAAALFSMRLR